MKILNLEPMLAVFGISGGEILLILVAMLVMLTMVALVVGLIVWLGRRNNRSKSPPPNTPAP